MNTLVSNNNNFFHNFTLPSFPEEALEFLQTTNIIEWIFDLISILILCSFIYILANKLVKTIISFYEYKFMISAEVDYDKLISIIDSIISNSISEYITLNGFYDQFIGEQQEADLRVYVSNSLNEQLSEAFLEKLEFIYKKDSIPDLLARRILTTISIYIAKNNAAVKK